LFCFALKAAFSQIVNVDFAGGVGSEKYFAANDWGIPVVEPRWIDACFNACARQDVKNFLLKPFSGLRFSITGFGEPQERRDEIVALLVKNGGRFTAAMRPDEVTHLVAETFNGPKCKATLTHTHVRVVNEQWVRGCDRHQRFLKEDEKYIVKSTEAENRKKELQLQHDMQQRERERTAKEEEDRRRAECEKEEALMKREIEILEDLKKSDEQLDVLNAFIVFIHGFEPKRWRTVQSLASISGATVLWEWNKTATHILLGNMANEMYLNSIEKENPLIRKLSTQDLIWCLEKREKPLIKKRKLNIKPVSNAKEKRENEKENTAHGKAAQKSLHKDQGDAERSGALDQGTRRPITRLQPKRVQTFDYSEAVICVSRYVGEERAEVERLVKNLGAIFVDRFTRSNPKVTLLISKDRTGPKCQKAMEWNVPIYSLEWLKGEASVLSSKAT